MLQFFSKYIFSLIPSQIAYPTFSFLLPLILHLWYCYRVIISRLYLFVIQDLNFEYLSFNALVWEWMSLVLSHPFFHIITVRESGEVTLLETYVWNFSTNWTFFSLFNNISIWRVKDLSESFSFSIVYSTHSRYSFSIWYLWI